MSMKDRKRPSMQLYPQDVVQSTTPPYAFGVVDKCWWDAEEDFPLEIHHPFGTPVPRPLKEREFSVSFVTDRVQREIKADTELRLVDRNIRLGEVCKRTTDDPRGQEIPGWKTKADLEEAHQPEIAEFVAYNDWIGQVVEIFDEALVEDSTNNRIVKISEISSGMYVGERGPDMMPTTPFSNMVTNMMSAVFGGVRTVDTVLDVKHTVYAIAWLAINQSLDPADAATRKRPKRYWAGKDLEELTMFPVHSDTEVQVSSRTRLKDTVGALVTQHGVQGEDGGTFIVNTYQVVETQTELDILWQDGSTETHLARDVVPHLNPDEYECWPGDYAVWKVDGATCNVVLQSVDAAERTAKVLLLDTGATKLVSLLELDRAESDLYMGDPQSATELLGVNRGDLVLIHRPGTINRSTGFRVPRIGELEPWVREVSENSPDMAWRKEMSDLGAEVAKSRGQTNVEEFRFKRVAPGDERYLWFGEVIGLNRDGSVVVAHVESTIRTYPVDRLTVLSGRLDSLQEGSDFENGDAQGSPEEPADLWTMEDGEWRPLSNVEDGWEDEDEIEQDDMDVDPNHILNGHDNDTVDLSVMDIDVNGLAEHGGLGHSRCIVSPSSPSHDSLWSELAESAAVANNVPIDGIGNATPRIHSIPSTTSSSPRLTPVKLAAVSGTTAASSLLKEHVLKATAEDYVGTSSSSRSANNTQRTEPVEGLAWKRFEILPSAPIDHAFYSQPPAQPGKPFMTRLNREYRALANSLPDTIIVRAYEDRSDLLRCLIIGPENTPYEDAPFVIDWKLDSNFPNSPPIAHFLSWTNGNGRVNPNLYEDGKVCLSILGTWQGDRTETWNPTRSSLLQAFVSIQGLVLVKEPWFCEPGYEKLRETEESKINSRLYSEKAYVLARGFVRRALEIPPGGLQGEIRWFYYSHGRLKKVLKEARMLVEKSRQEPTTNQKSPESNRMAELTIPRLTIGGIILLERTLGKLQDLLDTHEFKD